VNIIYKMFLHDFLYVAANSILKERDPCEITVSRSGLAMCIDNIEACCGTCKYIGINGCTVTCLGCKLSFCNYMSLTQPILTQKFFRMKLLCLKRGFGNIRTSRMDNYLSLKGKQVAASNIMMEIKQR